MSRSRDYYRVLHVQPDAPTEIISASYRTLMQRLRHHPDLGGDHDTAVLLNEAHAVLSDPERRAAYDASRAAEHASEPPAAPEADPLVRGAHCAFCNAAHVVERALQPDDECARCASPLFPAERHRLEYSGQRMLSRTPKTLAAQIHTAWPQAAAYSADLRDLSLNGMQVSIGIRLETNQAVRVDCELCRAVARVAYCRRDRADGTRWLAGLEFLTLRFAGARGTFVSTSV